MKITNLKPAQNNPNTSLINASPTQNPMKTPSASTNPTQNLINTKSPITNPTKNRSNKCPAPQKTKGVHQPGKPRRKAKVKNSAKNANTAANIGIYVNTVNALNPANAVSPMNLLEFTRKFPDERACREYLSQTRWSNGFLCPRCGSSEFYFHSRRDIRICKSCKHQLSLTSGTIFHKTRVPLQKWFWIIYHISIQKIGISALALKRMLDMPSYQTVWTICHKIRKAMADENKKDRNSCSLNIPAIPGISGIIEIDNTYLGSVKQKPWLTPEKDLISLDMDIQFTDMKVLPQGFVLPPLPQTQNKVKNKSSPNQDNTTFRFISSKNIIYNPKRKKKPVKPRNNPQTPNISGNQPLPPNMSGQDDEDLTMHWVAVMVNNLRTNLHGVFHGIGDKHLQRFIDEYCYKFNRRRKPEEIFDKLLLACTATSTITFVELTG